MSSNPVSRAFAALQRNRLVAVLVLLVVALLAAALVVFNHLSTRQSDSATYLNITAEQRVLAQQIANYTLEAGRGKADAFTKLRGARDRFDTLLEALKQGSDELGIPPSPQDTTDALLIAENLWLNLREKADQVLVAEDDILRIRANIASVNELAEPLQETANQVVQVLAQAGSDSEQIYVASRQLLLAQRIQNSVDRVLQGGAAAAAAIDQFAVDSREYGEVLRALLRGDKDQGIKKVTNAKAATALRENALLFSSMNDSAQQIIQTLANALPALEAVDVVTEASDQASEAVGLLSSVYEGVPGRWQLGQFTAGPLLITLLGLLGVAALFALGWFLVRQARERESVSEQANRRNQQAILRLLDEMGDLANGDLTVEATVTEDITGAIADSINYAIEALRNLVATINSTSDEVSNAAQESRATAMHLAEASDHQAQQISQANEAIGEVAGAIDEMSRDAGESASVAERSLEVAQTGAKSVRSTIYGMDEIREQIQETSKRIKRLGESSQQIGEIVELIDDISDQTNILALNASMQAAMAGDAGRGFAVVADEVQRLAERSGNATKQIEALVKTIQADTSEAVASMEESTSGVVRGAKLAEGAGDALLEIENVSSRIAELTKAIADRASIQASATNAVTDTMGVIQEITIQTSEGTTQTAGSIGQLADMADDLQQSVAGFRLPA